MPRSARAVSGEQRRYVALLGVPTLALALTTTVVTTYLPTVVQGIVGSSLVVGLIVGCEGLMALWLPLVVGTWSDRLRTRLGGRLPFLLAGTPVLVAGLVALGFVASTPTIVAAALVFFTGYFIAYEPYRALYPDALPDDESGRAQASQGVFRGAGTGLAIIGGGVLLGVGRPTPFIVGAAVAAVTIGAFVLAIVRRGVPDRPGTPDASVADTARHVLGLVRDDASLRAFLVANALWELALGALKTFIVLYVIELGFSRSSAGFVIGGVAVVVLLTSLGWGRLADRHGHARVMRWAMPPFGLGLLGPLLSDSEVVVAIAIPFVAAGGGALMALPYAILTPLMPDAEHGVLTGYYSFSRGLGTWLGPLLAGLAISLLGGGYQPMWLPIVAASLLSLVPLRTLCRDERERA